MPNSTSQEPDWLVYDACYGKGFSDGFDEAIECSDEDVIEAELLSDDLKEELHEADDCNEQLRASLAEAQAHLSWFQAKVKQLSQYLKESGDSANYYAKLYRQKNDEANAEHTAWLEEKRLTQSLSAALDAIRVEVRHVLYEMPLWLIAWTRIKRFFSPLG